MLRALVVPAKDGGILSPDDQHGCSLGDVWLDVASRRGSTPGSLLSGHGQPSRQDDCLSGQRTLRGSLHSHGDADAGLRPLRVEYRLLDALDPAVDIQASDVASLEHDGGGNPRIFECIMVPELNAESSGDVLEPISSLAEFVAPSATDDPGTVQPCDLQLFELVFRGDAAKGPKIECRMAYENGVVAHATLNLAPYLRHQRTARDTFLADSVNLAIPWVAPGFGVDKGLPSSPDLTTLDANNADLANAGTIRIRGLDIDGVECQGFGVLRDCSCP